MDSFGVTGTSWDGDCNRVIWPLMFRWLRWPHGRVGNQLCWLWLMIDALCIISIRHKCIISYLDIDLRRSVGGFIWCYREVRKEDCTEWYDRWRSSADTVAWTSTNVQNFVDGCIMNPHKYYRYRVVCCFDARPPLVRLQLCISNYISHLSFDYAFRMQYRNSWSKVRVEIQV